MDASLLAPAMSLVNTKGECVTRPCHSVNTDMVDCLPVYLVTLLTV